MRVAMNPPKPPQTSDGVEMCASKKVSFEIWRGAKVVNGVPPSRTPLIVQTLSVTAHMRPSRYGQAADIGGPVQPPRLNGIHAHGDI